MKTKMMGHSTITSMTVRFILVGGVLCLLNTGCVLPVVAQCLRDVYTSLPTAPVFPSSTLDAALTPPLSSLVTNHWSQVAVMERPTAITPVANPTQTGCPHLTGTFVDFHSLGFTNGSDVDIPANTRVLISSCSIPAGTVYGRVSIPPTSELIFGDAIIHFQARGIFIDGGKLLVGSQSCRLRNKVTITLIGARTAQPLPPADVATKGIWSVNGTVEIHGGQFFPTWSRLARTVNAGDDLVFIQDLVNWQVGQSIVVTTSELKDSRDFNRNEERIISQVFRTAYPGVTALRVTQAFSFKHFGGRAYQSEVGLLSRTIMVQGSPFDSEPTDVDNSICVSLGDSTYPCNNKYLTGFGAHVRIEGPSSIGRFSGVEFYRVGQTNILGRYAMHFHQVGQTVPAGRLFARDCSVHRSYFRAFAVHGSNNVVISQNVAYDVIGHAYFIEDGVEENNRFEYNLGAHVHWLGPSQNHDNVFGAQFSFWIDESPDLILPSDLGASVFYITNAYNEFIGNAASGGFSGYGIVNLPTPVKLNENYMGLGNFSPMARPLLLFKGNTAHSTAYWNEQVGALYVGGTLKHKTPGGILTYTAGRDLERHTCSVQPSTTWGWCQRADYAWLNFDSIKVWLANRGAQHWGVRARLERAEFHDVGMSSNVFGQVSLSNILINCRSLEHVPSRLCPSSSCKARDRVFFQYFFGFQWYDVGQNHIMTDVEFRNCNPNWSECMYNDNCGGASTFLMLTHSHRYVPEIMQASRNITYTNYNPNSLVKFTVSQAQVRTVSGRLSNWLDFDGTVFPGVFPGKQLILGSAWANKWWRTHNGCLGPKNDLFICPRGQDGVASVYLSYDYNLENQVQSGSVCPNGEGPCPIIGMATHFGRQLSEGLEIGQNSKLTGPIIRASGGWFVKLLNGSPRLLRIKQAQIHPDDNLILAFPYPGDTLFSIKAIAPPWCEWARVEETLVRVSSLDELRAGWGDRYFFDTVNQVLYLRVVQRNDECFPADTITIPWQKQSVSSLASFSSKGITLMVMEQWEFMYEITATNCGGEGAYCAVVTGDYVPPAIATQSPVVPATYAPSQPTISPTARPTPPCVALWAQCGSDQYTGCCLEGACIAVHQYYKQCQPATAPITQSPTITTTKTPSSPPSSLTKGPSSPPIITTSNAPSKTPTSSVSSIPPTPSITTPAPSVSSSTNAPNPSQGCAALWGQCGGKGWTGPACCVSDAFFGESTCVFGNEWYWQCQPASSVTNSPSAPSSTRMTFAPSQQSTRQPSSLTPTTKSLPNTLRPTTTKVPTSTQACAALWSQCGGQSWTGPTCCNPDTIFGVSVCVVDSVWYSQCQPASQQTRSPSSVVPVQTKAPSSAVKISLPGGTNFPTRKPTRIPTRRPSARKKARG